MNKPDKRTHSLPVRMKIAPAALLTLATKLKACEKISSLKEEPVKTRKSCDTDLVKIDLDVACCASDFVEVGIVAFNVAVLVKLKALRPAIFIFIEALAKKVLWCHFGGLRGLLLVHSQPTVLYHTPVV